VRGELKRVTFLLGLILLFCGAIVLNDPMSVEDRNCGSAIMRKSLHERRFAERCDAKLDRRRLPGFAMFAVGALVVLKIGPRCLLEPD
jgi:hypothetical protein